MPIETVLTWIDQHRALCAGIGAASATLGILEKTTGFGRASLRWIRHKFKNADALPRRTLTAVPGSEGETPFWCEAKQKDGRVLVQFSGYFTVTNVSRRPIRIARVTIGESHTFALVYAPQYGCYVSEYSLDPNQITKMMFTLFADAEKLKRQNGQSLSIDVRLTDNFNNMHVIKKVAFRNTHQAPPPSEDKGPPGL